MAHAPTNTSAGNSRVQINLQCRPEERELAIDVAHRTGKTVSGLIRDLIVLEHQRLQRAENRAR